MKTVGKRSRCQPASCCAEASQTRLFHSPKSTKSLTETAESRGEGVTSTEGHQREGGIQSLSQFTVSGGTPSLSLAISFSLLLFSFVDSHCAPSKAKIEKIKIKNQLVSAPKKNGPRLCLFLNQLKKRQKKNDTNGVMEGMERGGGVWR